MKREELEHLIRAAGAITESRRLLVIGSAAILGAHPDTPCEAARSTEASLVPLDHPERADLISGALGELSPFHDTFGYYAEGVDLKTAILPQGWEGRLVPIDTFRTNGHVGLCLEIHDLFISKLVAGREKDLEFCQAVVRAGLVDREVLLERLKATPIGGDLREVVEARISRWLKPSSDSTPSVYPSP